MKLTAPGKAFLAGEYAVLQPGGAALVVGVDRFLHASLRPLAEKKVEIVHRPSGSFVAGELTPDGIRWAGGIADEVRFAARAAGLAARLCAAEDRPQRGFSLLYDNDFAQQGKKIGLGGSAAACVLAVRGACAAQERSLAGEETSALAAAAHFDEQGGRGSGADVAACALGGLLEVTVRRPSGVGEDPREVLRAPPLAVRRLPIAPDLRLLLAFTGAPADSRALVGGVLEFARGNPSRYRARCQAISEARDALRDALEAAARSRSPDPREAALDAVRRAAAAMAALGEEARVAIVTPELSRACAIAASAGAAAKPSGAGGGDCAVVLAFDDAALDRAARDLEAAGFSLLRIAPALP
jgi:phosphomevalonate kinase